MNKNEYINKLIDKAINSTEEMAKATPKPFLLTRIHARIALNTETVWGKVAAIIARPIVLIPAFCMLVLINAMLVFYNNKQAVQTGTDQFSFIAGDEFSSTVATMYETDNQ